MENLLAGGATPGGKRSAQLREDVVAELKQVGVIVSPNVEAALLKVPRETFAPGFKLEAVYELWNGLVTKTDAAGRPLSSISAPHAQAHMLEQARIDPGMNVLEIGSGGMNAAYLAELVGPGGKVTTVDIDPFVTGRARQFLNEAGYPQVSVVLADAEHGVPQSAPYDRILVTVAAWDIPPAWLSQLTDTGLLVVPLKVHDLTRTVALVRHGESLVSESARPFGFVSMQGQGARDTTELVLYGGAVRLTFGEQPPTETGHLGYILKAAPVIVESGAGIRSREPWATMQMWLATKMAGFCRMSMDQVAKDAYLPQGGGHAGVAAVDGPNLAYVVTRRISGPDLALDVHGYGPRPEPLAQEMADHLLEWNNKHRGGEGPQYRIYPMGVPKDQLPPADLTVDKRHSRVQLRWV